MRKGQILTGQVVRMDFPNKGVVETSEGFCMVKNVLPGQKIVVMIQKLKRGKPEGRLLSVEEYSPLEYDAPCPHFGICGGCVLLSLPYEEQLKLKAGQLTRLLGDCFSRRFEGIHASPRPLSYRNKMEFTFGDEEKGGRLTLGLHKRGSFYDIVSVRDCQIADEDYRRILSFSEDYFRKNAVSFYHRMKHEGYLRHLLVRKAVRTGEILVALVTTSCEDHDLTEWINGILGIVADGKISGILHITNDSAADVVRSDRTNILYGRDWFYEEILGLRFKISVFSFFQTNSLGAEVLYETVRNMIGPVSGRDGGKPVIYDLYSGTGTIAQMMAPVAHKVIGVEIVEEAVAAAKENAGLNGLENVVFLAGDVLKTLEYIDEKPDFIILDPPRDGVHPKTLKKILAYGVDRLLYISCKPTSLARDMEEFVQAGYEIERAAAVDMFPGTGNVETVVLLSRKSKRIR